MISFDRKFGDLQKRDGQTSKRPNLNHTDYAYREAVNRLKSMLTDTYSVAKQHAKRSDYESDDAENISVIIYCHFVCNNTTYHLIALKIQTIGG